MNLEHWNERQDGALSEQQMRQKLEKKGYQVFRYVYSPGTFFPDHTHSIDKIDAVLSGRLKITMDGEEVVLEPGDSIEVPRRLVHSAAVVGDEPVVSLDATKR